MTNNINDIAILTGPNHAEEISLSKVCAAVIASQNPIFSKGLQKLFSSKFFRIYTSANIFSPASIASSIVPFRLNAASGK